MKILVLNCGSSSLKYQLIETTTESVLSSGLVERIGLSGAVLTHRKGEQKFIIDAEKQLANGTPITDHKSAVACVTKVLCDDSSIISLCAEIRFSESVNCT